MKILFSIFLIIVGIVLTAIAPPVGLLVLLIVGAGIVLTLIASIFSAAMRPRR